MDPSAPQPRRREGPQVAGRLIAGSLFKAVGVALPSNTSKTVA